MALRFSIEQAPAHIAADGSLANAYPTDAIVLLPDQISLVGEQTVASFRPAAQGLRAAGGAAGIEVHLVTPDGAKPAVYTERSADLVLPLIATALSGAAGNLIANEIQRFIDARRARGETRMPTARYREVVIEDGTSRTIVRTVEGPADEIGAWVRDHDDEDWQWPDRS